MQADTYISSNAPSFGASVESALLDFVGISPCANRMGKHIFQAHFEEKYTSKNIYARCQSSVGYLAW